ncbi:MAG: hypothetical protein H6810_11960 [Phycisphaeraceae bacterium]|nr:MAG: hypothetical protein H6810_11960 [Phycisphaeraceae bacterium]
MSTQANRALAGVLACLATLFTLAPSVAMADRGAAPKMVRPESLPQGFVVIVEDQAKMASASRPIYFASGANSWNPGDADYVLSPRSDGRWQYVFKGGELGENVEFKFTLGSWKYVETDPQGQDINNRHFPAVDIAGLAGGEQPVIELTVPKFREGNEGFIIDPEYRPLDVTGNVRRLQVAGGAGLANGTMRDLLVWLPPGYGDNPDRAYPVLYMMDGQNLFQKPETAPAEWHMDEIAQRMIQQGRVEPFIIVGVPHAGESRTEEYIPPTSAGGQIFGKTPHADEQVDWLIREVMPRVERAFRIEAGPDHTGVGGSSAGGAFALYAAIERPDVFGLVLAESPALQLDMIGLDEVKMYADASTLPSKVYLGMGGAEDIPNSGFYSKDTRRHIDAVKKLADELEGRAKVRLEIVENQGHNELAWAKRLPFALEFLFGDG